MELIITAFLLGLYGSGHCISMCGPVVGILGMNTQTHRVTAAFLYNLGRITTYSLLGIIAAILSIAMNDLKPIQLILRYLAGILMLFVALQFFGFPKFLAFVEKPLKNFTKPITKLSQRFFPINTKLRAYCAGMVWGLFPCGMVYAAFAISLSATSFIQAPLIMFGFGLGTFAVMVSLSIFGNYAGKFLTHPKLRIVSGILILAMTLMYLIPMLIKDLGLSQGMDHSMMNHVEMDHSATEHKSDIDHSLQKLTIDHNSHNIDTNANHEHQMNEPIDHSSMSH
ncbi:sulfite exporter TauE/SafE family protein [Wohlfahrtiimonas larvae]|uniref:Urease accessory protein UreH-like transmembrane domain-containing protein n=1 Tax=Wohlfahrtiimonas larvae TaxID=1157986 RepID=A0ABP9MWU1_9GAMM|nr:sulfite exporter TauE/SafE family protein [Wohlfahrtiimonas larvae]